MTAIRTLVTWKRPIGPNVCAPAVLAIGLLSAVPGFAATTTYQVEFNAFKLVIGSGPDSAPVDPVEGSFTVTFDPLLAVFDSTAGITLDGLNVALGSPLSFSFDPAGGTPGRLRVGGSFSGSEVIQFFPSTDDFWLYIDDFVGTPTFVQLGYTQTSVSSDNLFFTLLDDPTGEVSVVVIPEPGLLPLLALAAGGLLRWRHRRSVTEDSSLV